MVSSVSAKIPTNSPHEAQGMPIVKSYPYPEANRKVSAVILRPIVTMSFQRMYCGRSGLGSAIEKLKSFWGSSLRIGRLLLLS